MLIASLGSMVASIDMPAIHFFWHEWKKVNLVCVVLHMVNVRAGGDGQAKTKKRMRGAQMTILQKENMKTALASVGIAVCFIMTAMAAIWVNIVLKGFLHG